MAAKLSIDIETYSEADLKKAGVYVYAEHPSTEILCMSYRFDDEPVQQWRPGTELPERIVNHVKTGGRIYAYNAQFERVVLNGTAGRKIRFPRIAIEQTRCTMAKARVHGLPGALGQAANALGTHPKQEEGKGAMMQLSKPRRGAEKRWTPENAPEKFEQLYSYCDDDVYAESDIDATVPDLTPEEQARYELDQKINERGIMVDKPAVHNMLYLVDEYKKRLATYCRQLTGFSPTQTGKLADWIRSNGYPQLENLQAPTVQLALDDEKCPFEARRALQCYSTHNMKAVAKLQPMLTAASHGDRLRGMLLFYGAGPGRWSSRIVQLQNLMRPVIKDPDAAIEIMRARDLDWLRGLYHGTDAMKVIASCIRGMLIAKPDHDLIAVDYAQIESRIQAWLANAEWKLEYFREGKHKIYNVDGSMMFGIPPEQVVDKGEDQTYTAAKIGSLACGYQGWAGAIEKFARDMNVKLSIPAEEIGQRWRDANSEQVQLWYDLQDAAYHAVKFKGRAFTIKQGRISFKVIGRWLYMRLPSGRRLAYLDPEVRDGSVTYMGIDTYTRRWMRVSTYGGKLLQNACEGIGRDLLACGLMNCEEAGYDTILTVHDEGVWEVHEDFGSLEEVIQLMTIPLGWAEGLPVKADGWRGKRFRK